MRLRLQKFPSSPALLMFGLVAIGLLAFQNCGPGFGVYQVVGTQNPSSTLPKGIAALDFNSCYDQSGATGVLDCLGKLGAKLNDLLPEDASLCVKSYGETKFDLALCLTSRGLAYPSLTQANVVTCISNSSITGVAACLKNSNLTAPRLTQLRESTGVFGQNCYSCHSAPPISGNLNLASYPSLSAVVVPGNPTGSRLIQRVTAATAFMPPTGLLPPDVIRNIKAWIADGARDN